MKLNSVVPSVFAALLGRAGIFGMMRSFWSRLSRGGLLIGRGALFALCASLCALLPAYAAKGDKIPGGDKPDKRIDKIERKLERAGMDPAQASQAIAARQQMMAATPPAEPDRSYRDRSASGGSDRPSSGSRRSDRDRNTYREPTTKADAKYDAFRIIVDRNIFNPTRIGRARPEGDERPVRVDTIAFVGTMQDDRRTLAFFDSPDAAFRKTLREGESVGEFKVQKIKPDEVELSRGDKPVTLKLA